jgi:pantoate--beta-alanine ligase
MRIVRTIQDLHAALEPLREGRTVGLVPTMGAYHEGHLSLFRAARAENDLVVVSLFVNPAQFDSRDDLAAYPRDEARDAKLAGDASVDLLFSPSADELYPAGYATWVDVEGLADRLEGVFRPGHFRGVATVCVKLFNLVRPERAYFGQKDAQQAALVQQLVRDLDLDVEVRVLPTVRDTDGLALSSRNIRLNREHRQAALALPRALTAGAEAFVRGADPAAAAQHVLDEEPLVVPQYVETARFNGRLVLAAAARVGGIRLIDNVTLEEDPT